MVHAVPPERHRELPARVVHGGPDYAELEQLGLCVDGLLDFSVNSNPLGASHRAMEVLRGVDPSRYPDSETLALRRQLAALHGLSLDEVLVGNGSVELIWLLARVYLEPGDTALVVGPTFGEYEAAARAQGAETVVPSAGPEDSFQPQLNDLCRLVSTTRARLLFLCNPNNPTGQALGLEEIASVLAACAESLLVVDEAYIEFADRVDSALALRADQRLVVLRSLTKSFGLAGLRLGYALGATSVIEALRRAQPPWSVNSLAQAAGLAALEDREHLIAGQRLAAEAKAHLVDGLRQLGLSCVPSRTNFWLVHVGRAAELRSQLLRRGILVRDCASFGLPEYVRLAARPLWECKRLLEVLASLSS